jgi:hypothetical protein
MLVRTPLVALGVALGVAVVATVAPAQAPKAQAPASKTKSKTTTKTDATKKEDAAKDEQAKAAKMRRLRQLVGADRGPGGGGPGGGGPGGGGPGGGGRGGRGGNNNNGIMQLLVLSEPLQDELKMTDKQKLNLRKLSDKSGAQIRQLFQGNRFGRGQSPQEQQLAMAQMQEGMMALEQQRDAAFTELLKPTQATRLQQVVLQIKGPLSVAEPEIAQEIGLESDQLQQVQLIVSNMQNAQQELMRSLRPNFGPGGPGGMVIQGGPGGNGAPGAAVASPAQGKNATTKGATGAAPAAKKVVTADDEPAAPPAQANANANGPQGKGQRRQLTPEEQAARQAQRDKADADSEKLREKAVQEVSKVLTSSQKTSFNRLLGKKIHDLSTLLTDDAMMMGGGPGGFGGFGGGGPGGGGPGGRGGPGGGGQPGGAAGKAAPPADDN